MTTLDGTPTIALLSPASFAHGQPHDQFAWLREHDPVHWHDEPGRRAGVLGGHALPRRQSGRARRGHVLVEADGIMIPDNEGGIDFGDHEMMISADPPVHTGLRKLVAPEFIPRAAKAMRPRIEELAARIIDGVAHRGECDLVTDIAGLMPSYVIADMLGIPLDDGVELYGLTEKIHAAPGVTGGRRGDGCGAGDVQLRPRGVGAQARRAGRRPRHADRHGDGRRPRARRHRLQPLLPAAHRCRRRHDAQPRRRRHGCAVQPSGAAGLAPRRSRHAGCACAIEELLRWISPVVYMRRTAMRDTELDGVPIAAGQKVVMYYGSANRDPEAFGPTAGVLDLARTPNDHVAFGGGGPHFCLGAHIARIEIHALLRELLTRLVDVRPAGETEWLPSTFISGPKHLPITF